MSDRDYWTKALRKAEQELDAATTRTAINAAAKRVMLAKRELKRLEQKAPTRQVSGVAAPAALPKRITSLVDLESRRFEVP